MDCGLRYADVSAIDSVGLVSTSAGGTSQLWLGQHDWHQWLIGWNQTGEEVGNHTESDYFLAKVLPIVQLCSL